jgi:hypothetical protein
MHTLIFMGKESYKDNITFLAAQLAEKHSKACYISFNDPYHIVIDILQDANVHHKYIVVDASSGTKDVHAVNSNTYVVSVDSLFDVYVFLSNVIKQESVSMLLVDSLSSLIDKHSTLPLKEMMTNLLLQVGAMKCSTNIIAFNHHLNHEVVSHLNPLIAGNLRI